MALTTATIKSRLAAAPSQQKDNEAQNIINGATAADLKGVDVEGVLRLFEALAMLAPRYYSARDKAAMKKLALNSQFQIPRLTPKFAVDTVKAVRKSKPTIQSQLTPDLVTRIYAAENKRLSALERVGIDGDTIGRGQLGNGAYTDVKSARHFKKTWEKFFTEIRIARLLGQHAGNPMAAPSFNMATYKVVIPTQYSMVWRDPCLEDFVVAAYLSIKIDAATKLGRSAKDSARFAVAIYHGMYSMVRDAQKAAKDDVNWAPVELELKSKGKNDEVAYVHEVVK